MASIVKVYLKLLNAKCLLCQKNTVFPVTHIYSLFFPQIQLNDNLIGVITRGHTKRNSEHAEKYN